MFARKNAVDGTRTISTPSWTIRGSFASSRSFPVTTVTSKSRGELAAELREEVGGRLDPGPVVLVEDEQSRLAGAHERPTASAGSVSTQTQMLATAMLPTDVMPDWLSPIRAATSDNAGRAGRRAARHRAAARDTRSRPG